MMNDRRKPSLAAGKRSLWGCFAFFSRFTNEPSRTIGAAAFVIAIAGIASRLLGFIRDRLLASRFGAGDTLDVYYAAFRIPDTIYNLLVIGALSAAFVPIFTEFLAAKEEKKAWKLAAEVLEWLVLFLGGIALLALFFSDAIVALIAPGFSADKKSLTTELTRLMLLSPLFLGVSAVFGGILISFNRFIAYSLAPLLYNLGIIVGIVFLVPVFGPQGLAYGVVLGAFFHMAVQIPAVKRSGFSFRQLSWKFRPDASVREVIRLMIPRTLAMAVNQLGFLFTTIFASGLFAGSLAVFNFAYNIQSIPLGLFGVAFSLAAFPILSLSATRKDGEAFFATLSSTTIRILFFVVPLSMFFIVFRAQFVRIILGSGHFNWEDTVLTFDALKWFSISLFAQSLIPLFARGFFALKDTRTPLYVALASEAIHIMLLPMLIPTYGVSALAMAFSFGSIINGFLLYVFLRKKSLVWREREFLVRGGKIIFATLFAGVIAQLSKSLFALSPSPLDTFIEVFEQLMLGLFVGGGAFLLASEWLKIEELRSLKWFIVRKVLRLPEAASSIEGHPEKGEW